MQKFFILSVLVLVALYVASAEKLPKLPPPIRGFKFTRCFRKCRKENGKGKAAIKLCGVKCVKKTNTKFLEYAKDQKEKEEKVKAMADFGIPAYAFEEMRRHNKTFKPFFEVTPEKPIATVKSDSNDVTDPAQAEKLWAQYRQELFSFFKQGFKELSFFFLSIFHINSFFHLI